MKLLHATVESIAQIDKEKYFNDATFKKIAQIDKEKDLNDATVETISEIKYNSVYNFLKIQIQI